ncbi:MAG: choice-of-anchor D domain-containing protein, partial [Myxococcaceae bacterium]
MILRGALFLIVVACACAGCGTKQNAGTLEVDAASSVETTFATAWASCPQTAAGQSSVGTLKVTNRLARPLVIQEIGSALGIATASSSTAQIVDAFSARELALNCAPRSVETARDELTLTTDAGTLTVGVTVIGTGSRLRVDPASFMFGDVDVGFATVLPLQIRNTGNAALRFKNAPSINVTNANVELETPIAAGTMLGANGALATRIFVRPLQPGGISGTIHFETDDPAQPSLDLTLTGTAIAAEACALTLTPAEIRVLSPRDGASLAVTAHNAGAGSCVLSGFRFEGSTPSLMSFVGLPPLVRIGAGNDYRIIVHADPVLPPLAFPDDLKMTFYANAPSMQPGELRVSSGDPALTSMACLTIAPSDLDFGTVQQTCLGGPRVVNLYNTCGVPVTVSDIHFANCPSSISCNGFQLQSKPPPGTVINPGTGVPVSMGVRFVPQVMGLLQEALVVSVKREATTEQYVVTMFGRGDVQAIQTEVYSSCARPTANLLFVVGAGAARRNQPAAFASHLDAILSLVPAYGAYQAIVVSAGADGGVVSATDGGTNSVLRQRDDPNFVGELRARILAAASDESDVIASTVHAVSAYAFTPQDAGTSLRPILIADRPDTSVDSVSSYLQQLDAAAPGWAPYVIEMLCESCWVC